MFDGVIKMFNEIINNQMFIVGFAIIVTLMCIGIFYMILGFVIFTLPMLLFKSIIFVITYIISFIFGFFKGLFKGFHSGFCKAILKNKNND